MSNMGSCLSLPKSNRLFVFATAISHGIAEGSDCVAPYLSYFRHVLQLNCDHTRMFRTEGVSQESYVIYRGGGTDVTPVLSQGSRRETFVSVRQH